MRILVVGGGGREHTLVWKISQSPLVKEIFCAPGNIGIASLAKCVPIEAGDVKGLAALARQERIDLTVVGPEVPLVEGLGDLLAAEGLPVFGPQKEAAALEGSKVFSKDLMRRLKVPTAGYETFTDFDSALAYVKEQAYPLVVKAEGLAAGKGVIIAEDLAEAKAALKSIMLDRVFGRAGNRVVVEEFLRGEEASLLAFTDGETVIPMISSQDHKPAYDGDKGPNTGGMGAYAPAPVLTEGLLRESMEKVMIPVVHGLKDMGITYRGVLYAGLMLTEEGPRALEFNVRFGDPEAQAVLPLMKTDMVPVMQEVARGSIKGLSLDWYPGSCACVVMASGGYPRSYPRGLPITGLEEAGALEQVTVFHAGTSSKEGKVVTAGGRVLGVTARGHDLQNALKRAYQAVDLIQFKDRHFRRDIGQKALK